MIDLCCGANETVYNKNVYRDKSIFLKIRGMLIYLLFDV